MKYSDGSMLTRSDITILMQQVDVTKAYDLLAMFKEAGKERIDIRTILDEAAPKIKDYSELVARLEQLSMNHATCSCGTSYVTVRFWLQSQNPQRKRSQV